MCHNTVYHNQGKQTLSLLLVVTVCEALTGNDSWSKVFSSGLHVQDRPNLSHELHHEELD